jgi:hypothetical protein
VSQQKAPQGRPRALGRRAGKGPGEEGETLMARPLPRRAARGRFVKAKPPPLDPALVRRLGTILADCVTYDNVLETLRPPREPIWEGDLR